jgi:hypothetical protein
MKRYSKQRHGPADGDQSQQISNDLAWGLLSLILASLVVLILVVNPKAVTQVPDYEALKITTTWDTCLSGSRKPGQSKSDVDTWILGEFEDSHGREIRDILGYSTRDRKTKYFILDQDDKGYFAPNNADYLVKKEDQLNREVIKSAKYTLTDGLYHVNLHMFSDKGELAQQKEVCVDVQVVIFQGLKGKEKMVCDLKAKHRTPAKLTKNKQELTVCQFEIRNGDYVIGSELNLVQNPFIKSRRTPTINYPTPY